ncbi:MAG: hypothetical protein J0M33_29055 [Anaerolineae bacterium]|nr:hypothetical protein [Anaerolineae bacterium]
MTDTTPLVITLNLPESEDETKPGTLLVGRGDLAHLRQFSYTHLSDLGDIIAEAMEALAAVEGTPPIIPESPKTEPKPATSRKSSTKASAAPVEVSEPTIDIPLKKGQRTIPISHLKLTGGDTDAAAYQQAIGLAGKLIDGGLWDGASAIRIPDVYVLQRKIGHLSPAEVTLFSLDELVEAEAVPA